MMQDNDYGHLIEPSPVPFQFETPGWYVLGGLLLLLLIITAALLVRHYRRNRYRRNALRWLDTRLPVLTPRQQWREADGVLKYLAMQVYGNTKVAPLQGEAWMQFLNQCLHRQQPFSAEDGTALQAVLYRDADAPPAAFITKTKYWILHHRHAHRDRI